LKDLKNKIDSLLLLSHKEVNGNKPTMMILWHQLLLYFIIFPFMLQFIVLF
jgi:hypothetical protein